MIKIIVGVFIALMPISFITVATLPAIKDPFFIPTIITCDEREQQFISQFSGWQYQGLVRPVVDEKKSVITVWLTNQKQWLQMSSLNPSTQFSSWHIVVIAADYIKWQAELPAYCNKQLSFTMTFLG